MTPSFSPKISVIMAAHNVEKFIAEAIESILAQTYKNWELIITDDASTDKTRTIISNYQKSNQRIKLIALDQSVRQTIARVKAIEQSTGNFLAILDADDIALPSRFKAQIDFLSKHPEVAVVGTAAELINENGQTIGRKAKTANFTELAFNLLLQTQLVHSSVCMRREAYEAVGGYDVINYRIYAEEYDLWNRLITAGYQITNLTETLVKYRLHPKSISLNDKTGIQSDCAFRVNELNIRRYLPSINRSQVRLLSKLINRPSLTWCELAPALKMYRKLALAYIASHQLEGNDKNLIWQIYKKRKWHTLRVTTKKLLHLS